MNWLWNVQGKIYRNPWFSTPMRVSCGYSLEAILVYIVCVCVRDIVRSFSMVEMVPSVGI